VVTPTWGDTPSWYLSFEPLTFLTPFTAYWIWFAINVVSLAAAPGLLLHRANVHGAFSWVVAGLMVLYPPVAQNFWYGQSEIFLLLLFTLFILQLEKGSWLTAAALLAAATLLRAYPVGLLAFLAVRRKWSTLAASITFTFAGLAVTYLLAPVDMLQTFIRNAPHSMNQPIGIMRHPGNLDLDWFVRFVLHQLFHMSELSSVSRGVSALTLIAFTFIVCQATLKCRDDWRAYCLWIVAISLMSPIMWVMFMACFVIVFIAIAGATLEGTASVRTIAASGAAYAVLRLFSDSHKAPFEWVSLLTAHAVTSNRVILGVMGEGTAISLALTLLAAYWFVIDTDDQAPAARESTMKSIGGPG
jgi:hypothetical protein